MVTRHFFQKFSINLTILNFRYLKLVFFPVKLIGNLEYSQTTFKCINSTENLILIRYIFKVLEQKSQPFKLQCILSDNRQNL